MKIKYLLLLIILLTSCKTKQMTLEKVDIKDTVYVNREVIVTKNVKQQLKINDLCDSLGLKEIEQVYVQGETRFKVITKDNYIKVDIDVDSIKTSAVNTYKSHHKEVAKEKETIRYVTPLWAYKTMGGLIIIVILLLIWIFRKYIPYLNILFK